VTSTKRHFADVRLGKLLPERLRLEPLGVGLLTLLLLAQCLATASLKSVTYDEVGNLPAGYSYLKTNDYRLYPVNPPLIKQIAALPLLFMNLRLPIDHWSWNEERTDHTEFGREFLFHYNHNPDRVVFWGRFSISILSVVLALLVYRFAKELFGAVAGIFKLPFIIISDYRYEHNPRYGQQVEERAEEERARWRRRRQALEEEMREARLKNMFSVSKSGEKLVKVVRSVQELASELDETSRAVTGGEYSFLEAIKDQRDRETVLTLAGSAPIAPEEEGSDEEAPLDSSAAEDLAEEDEAT